MQVLIVNNKEHGLPEQIERLVPDADTVVVDKHIVDVSYLANTDFVILSGSSDYPIPGNEDTLAGELELIRAAEVPVLGICYGCELIVTAYGGALKELPDEEMGVVELEVLAEGRGVFGGLDPVRVFEGHQWTIDTLPEEFTVLARSKHGIEAIAHKTKPIYGFQFHPEKCVDETVGDAIFTNLFKSLF